MNIISLFSGAGGLDLGFIQAGFNIIWANEKAKKVKKTYEYNHPNTIFSNKDITLIPNEEIPSENIDGIIGGPPCQSWSVAGNMKGKVDKRGALIDDYLRVISHVRPKFFLFENVKGIISKTHIDDFNYLLTNLTNIGYSVSYKVLNAVDYHVPQTRERVFIVGFLSQLDIDFEFPRAKKNQISLRQALANLPPQKPFDREISTFDSNEYVTGTFSSIFMSRNRIRYAHQPSFTIQASGRQAPLHYSSPGMIKIQKDKFVFSGPIKDVRRLSVRECARIQTFPDDFQFIYSNINDAYKMIGNAVPVHLAKIIAETIKVYLY